MKVFHNLVLVEPEKTEGTKTQGGIYMPEVTRDVPSTGILIDGGDVLEVVKGVKVRIWYRKWAGDDVKIDGKEYKIIEKADLLAYEEVKLNE